MFFFDVFLYRSRSLIKGIFKKIIFACGVFFCSFVFSLNAFCEDCTYQFDLKNSVVQGTGYKFTEKTGVSGRFKGFKLSRNEKRKNIKKLLKDLVVTVDLTTLDSGDAMRDKNMVETLFSGLVGGSTVTVSVKKVTDKTIQTRMKINKKVQEVLFNYDIKGEILTAKGRFDTLKYALGKQIETFKKRCGLLHTGQDGKSMTWTDFDLSVTAKIVKTCKKIKSDKS